jgi:hypothetical protein
MPGYDSSGTSAPDMAETGSTPFTRTHIGVAGRAVAMASTCVAPIGVCRNDQQR